jgi:hypothetical protein
MVNMATLVFPAPVDAHKRKFSGINREALYTLFCTLLSCFIPENAGYPQFGISDIFRSSSPSASGFAFNAGTWTSSLNLLHTISNPFSSKSVALLNSTSH